MSYTEPITNQGCKSQAEADALHAEIVRRQDIVRRADSGISDAERAALYHDGIGMQPVAEPQSYPRIKRGGVAVFEPPSISIVPTKHVVKRRRRFYLW